jgi:hypothetical protein
MRLIKKTSLSFLFLILLLSTSQKIFAVENKSDSYSSVDETKGTPEIKNWKSKTGSKVFFLETSGIPIIDIAIDIDGGSRWDPIGLEGLSSFVSSLIFKGSFVNDFEDLKISEDLISEFFC